MKKILLLIVALSLITSFLSVNAQALYSAPTDDTVQDFHIDRDGYVKISQAKVFQIAGTSFFVRYYFGLAFIRLLVKTDNTTKVYRRFGDEITLDLIKEGDIINIEGKIEGGSDSLNVVASKLTDFSNQKQITGFRGIISGTGSSAGSLQLTTENRGVITINTNPSTQIKKGSRIIGTDLVRNGDRVTDATGTFDHATKTLDANVVVIYTDMDVYKERNFEGTFDSLNGSNPQTITFTTGGKTYTLNLNSNAIIMRKNRNPASLKRFVEGDTIRVFGKIREAEEPIIDTEVIRNLNL